MSRSLADPAFPAGSTLPPGAQSAVERCREPRRCQRAASLPWHASCDAGETHDGIFRRSSMSLFGALNTAVSGLGAQSAAFSNISDNVANSQTVGFKGVNTAFQDLVTTSTGVEQRVGRCAGDARIHQQRARHVSQSTDPLGAGDQRTGVLCDQRVDRAEQYRTSRLSRSRPNIPAPAISRWMPMVIWSTAAAAICRAGRPMPRPAPSTSPI